MGMKVQVLASVMKEEADTLLERMHIESDAVIINQCEEDTERTFVYHGHRINFVSMAEKGIGKSRNHAIDRADSDICLFSDADIVYEEGYEQAILREFECQPQADMILFNIKVAKDRQTYHITERKGVKWYNCGRYGAVSFAIRRDKLLESGVRFSLLFGGGAKYSNGEDSLFLKEFMSQGYRVYTAPVLIGEEKAQESSWFTGYNQKFYFDRGVLYHFLYGNLASLMALRFIILRQRKHLGEAKNIWQAFWWMQQGMKRGKEEKTGR